MSQMPPAGTVGSKKGKRKQEAGYSSCLIKPTKDLADSVKKLGDGCAATSKMKAISPMLKGTQADKDTHQENKVRVEANHCYRVYIATDEQAKDVVVVVRDSAGDIVVESPGPAIPDDGKVCFTASDEVSLLVSIGSGKGSWSAQLWGD